MARPTKLSPKTRNRICDSIRKGVPRERAGRLAGISPPTFHRWMAMGLADEEQGKTTAAREFRAMVLRAEDELIERALASVVDAFEQEDGRYVHELRDRIAATRFMLPHRFSSEFSTRQEVTGKEGAPVQVQAEVAVRPLFTDEQLAAMTPEQLQAALSGLK
jgi:hypothetical protein